MKRATSEIAVVLAAGRGKRLNGTTGHPMPKPLVLVNGVPLISRNIQALEAAGIDEIVVVVGYRGDEVAAAVSAAVSDGTTLHVVHNPRWEYNSGLSLLAARQIVGDRDFFLAMADHVTSPDILIGLRMRAANRPGCYLAVDHNVTRVYDLAGQIKVTLEADRVSRIGRSVDEADAIDTRCALMTSQLFDALASLDNPRLTDGLRVLAQNGHLQAHDIGASLWQDVDTPETLRHAEWLLEMYGEELQPLPRPHGATNRNDPERTLAYVQGILAEKEPEHYVLYNPGPVITSARVKSALIHHDVCHRDETFSTLMTGLRRKLKRIYGGGSEHEVLLITGSGTSGVEAAISSTVPADGKLLIINNGAFGERFLEITQLHGIDHHVLRYEWGELVNPADVEALLAADPSFSAVVMTHHETSVGLINPVRAVGQLCRRFDKLFIVDAVASLGGEDIDVRRDMVDICVSSANKCLHAISGVATVCVHDRVWERIEEVPPRVYYLDLKRYRDFALSREETPFTPAVSNFYALDAAADELLVAGVQGRIRTYRRRNGWIKTELRAMGFGFFTETGHESQTILCVEVPRDVAFDALYREMRQRGFIIYGCKAHLAGRYFQIANMGELTDQQITAFLGTLRMVLTQVRRKRSTAIAREARVAVR